MGTIGQDRDGRGVLTLTLDNPGRRNALSDAMIHGLADIFEALAADTALRAVVLRGAGGTFCAGRDLHDLLAVQQADPAHIAAIYDRLEAMGSAIHACPVPLVAAVEGHCYGLGAMLALWSDIALADAGARFGFPEVRHGVAPFGAVPAMAAVMPPRAVDDLLLTGRRIDAAEAAATGIVTRAVPAGTLGPAVDALLSDLLSGDAQAIRQTKAFRRDCAGRGRDASVAAATRLAKAVAGRSAAAARIGAFIAGKPAKATTRGNSDG